MAIEIVMPRLGWTMQEGTLVEWLKRDGEEVKAGEIIFTVETEKAVHEVESFESGVLREGRMAGAGLDTFEGIDIFSGQDEPPSHPLLELDNVILTPHVSGLSVQAISEVAMTGVQNVVSVLSGRLPHPENIVNRGVTPRIPLADHDPSLFRERPE